jgi:hypothetical protein
MSVDGAPSEDKASPSDESSDDDEEEDDEEEDSSDSEEEASGGRFSWNITAVFSFIALAMTGRFW